MNLTRLLPVVLILLLAGLSALLFGEYLHQTVLVPLAYLIFLAGEFLNSLPQVLWWVLLLVLMLVLIARSYSVWAAASEEQPQARPIRPLSRAEEWTQLASQARRGGYLERQYRRRVGGLALDILAQQRRMERKSLEGLLRSGELNLPPHLRRSLIEALEGTPQAEKPQPRLPGWGRPSQTDRPAQADPLLELLSFLEKEIGTEGEGT
jgi:hypothetical protein